MRGWSLPDNKAKCQACNALQSGVRSSARCAAHASRAHVRGHGTAGENSFSSPGTTGSELYSYSSAVVRKVPYEDLLPAAFSAVSAVSASRLFCRCAEFEVWLAHWLSVRPTGCVKEVNFFPPVLVCCSKEKALPSQGGQQEPSLSTVLWAAGSISVAALCGFSFVLLRHWSSVLLCWLHVRTDR